MNKEIALFVALSASLAAQGTTLPPGYDSTEAPEVGYYFGSYADQRTQLCTAMFNGQVTVMNRVDFRPDGSSFSASLGVARSWKNVTLQVSDANYASLSTTFSSNATTTPTTVFSGPVSWGAVTSAPPTTPAAWALGGQSFAFSNVFLSTGKSDLLLDFTFSGGTLSNAATWGTARKSYYLDSVTYEVFTNAGGAMYGDYSCISPLSNRTYPDQHVLWNYTYGKSNGTIYDDMIRYHVSHQYSPPSKAHFGAIGQTGVTTVAAGISLGGCQPLMLTPLIIYPFVTDSVGYWASPTATLQYNASYVGVTLWGQAAHDANGVIHLSRVSRSQVQAQPAPAKDYTMIYRSNLTSTTGVSTQIGIPVVRIQ